jgi:hypothetical protein
VIVGDILHEANSALDYVAWQLALKTRSNPDRRTGFPVCVKDGDWDRRGTRDMLQHIASADRDWIKTRQPYPAPHGERPETHGLAMLRELARIDKHQVLHTALLIPQDIDVETVIQQDIAAINELELFVNHPVEDGAPFALVSVTPSGPRPKMKVNVEMSLYVGFVGSDYGWMEQGRVFYALEGILHTVTQTVDQAAARF